MGITDRQITEDDERRLKNLATKIMSNGVEVLVKDKHPDNKNEQTKHLEVKTIHPTVPSHMFQNNALKIDKRIDDENDFDLIQPSEVAHVPCTTSCSCSHTKTEGLKTTHTNQKDLTVTVQGNYAMKTSKYGATKLDVRPSNKETFDKKTQYGPYEFESSSQLAPNDKVVEKYTEVISDYSDENDTNSLVESELLTNEQAPLKTNKVSNKNPEKSKPEKPQKPNNKNKFVVADLLKLGTLGIKGLSQLAPVIEKMTGGFIKRQDMNKTVTTTVKPVTKITGYNANKRLDSEMESKQSSFPIYIPVDELETSESQIIFTNATLHQNLAWAAEHKQPKAHIVPPKIIHESPLVNGGIPISPGEIITAHSDVIVGKPAVGGPLTLAASGIKLHNPVNPPPIDSFVSENEQYLIKEKPPLSEQTLLATKVDDSFDLRPPELPKLKPNRRPSLTSFNHQNPLPNKILHSHQSSLHITGEHDVRKVEPMKTTTLLGNHGRPAFLDYIPSLVKPPKTSAKPHVDHRPLNHVEEDQSASDNNPSSSEVINTHVTTNGEHVPVESISKPFLVDIQPSRVANVLIPHGSSTALVFAGSSEPHKTGDYVDDPLPYPEPGYFGSFSIDAPQMTNVHNVPPNNNKQQFSAITNIRPPLDLYKPNLSPPVKEQAFRNDLKSKWKDNKHSVNGNKISAPTSSQQSHVQFGPQIAVYNPDIYSPNNGDFEKYHQKGSKLNNEKEVIDKEYENYLAVPPPPPPKIHYNQESYNDKNKPYHQRPIIHTKPVQDMKVFLNIQHPVPKIPSHEQPSKVTSEIYFAAQSPNGKPTPTYTIHIPPSTHYGSTYDKVSSNQLHKGPNTVGSTHHSFSVVTSPNTFNKSMSNDVHHKEATYSVTLNTATNVASNVGDAGQVIGSSIPVSIGTSATVGQMNTDIPIGTNFAIRVEDGSSSFESFSLNGNRNPPTVYDEYGRVPNDESISDNKRNKSNIHKNEFDSKPSIYEDKNSNNRISENSHNKNISGHSIPMSLNSHANFPMIHDQTQVSVYQTTPKVYETVRPITEHIDQKRPAKVVPNIPTNSHYGWYSSIPTNENSFNIINNIKIDATTRKVIPLLHDYEKDNVPDFGQKISTIGKPPTEFWVQNASPILTNYGKPFSKQKESDKQVTNVPLLTTKPFNSNYIPSIFNVDKQPAYDIPIRDNGDDTTTVKTTKMSVNEVKPVYENSEEIYDGEEEVDKESDSEISSESMKVPIVSTSNDKENVFKSTTAFTLLQDEVFAEPGTDEREKTEVNFNTGTQTEKPFVFYNKTTMQSNTIKPIYSNYSYMKPRPFTINTLTTLDHQLQQPHWQINQLMENSTNVSYEESLELNTGEEINTISTTKPTTAITPKPFSNPKIPYRYSDYGHKYKRPQRPVFSIRPYNGTYISNDSNIITSTVHIKDKKPLIVEEINEKSTLPTFTTSILNHSSSGIIDLSPPPPTLDYNFKPSTNDEMIMGMSPPPPRTPSAIRPPMRVSPTPRPIPVRTPSPYRSKPPRTLPPRPPTQRPTRKPVNRDDISTYRPAYDILNNVNRPQFNRDQPSSHLLPPPREIPSKVVTPVDEIPKSSNVLSAPNVVFPTPVSSGWLTSSGVEFSSRFEFAPTSVHFSGTPKPSLVSDLTDVSYTESSNSYEPDSYEQIDNNSSKKPEFDVHISKEDSTELSSETSIKASGEEENVSDSVANESSQEESTTGKIALITGDKNRTRKPYPVRKDDTTISTNTYRLPPKPTSIIRPTKTLSRPDTLYPTRHTSTRKIVRPIPIKSPSIIPASVIESSESFIEEDFIKPTEVLKVSESPTIINPEITLTEKLPSTLTSIIDDVNSVTPTHHAGNEVKIIDEIIPTKTEFKTTVITLTKTLSEPPKTISSVGYINLTHTLTVTHTKTSLVSQSEGAVTQTLVLTNTQTSTVVDVVTKIHTQVQPTTIIETVTKHIPVAQVEPTPVVEVTTKTKVPLDDISLSSEENDNLTMKDNETTENIQKVGFENENDNETFFVVMNKAQNGGQSPPVNTDIETSDYDGVTRNEQVNSNGVSQVLFGEILLAGTPYLETTNVANPTGVGYGKECQPDCKASRNERCQRIDGIMKCVCRPGFARMFPDRPCKPTYTYSVRLALNSQGNEYLQFHENLSDNSSKQYQALAVAAHEGINRMVMQSDLRDVFHGVHITGFQPVEMKKESGELYKGVINDFYVQLSDNAHESRLKEVIEKYLRTNNYSLGGTDVHAAGELMNKLEVNDFDECTSGQFHDCSEHAQCFNLRGTYTCSCLEGYADLSVNNMYPGRICSAEPVGCERCNYHGACYSRDDQRVLCECFQWYTGSTCQINLKVVLISLVVVGVLLTIVLTVCAVVACSRRPRPPPRSIVACIQNMPGLHQSAMPSKQQRADRRALISERGESGDASSVQNASLPYIPAKRPSSSKKCVISDPPAHDPPPPPAPAVMIPRARLHPHHGESRENITRKKSLELSSEEKLISYLESGAVSNANDEMRRKHSMESSYSANKDRQHNKQGALVSAGFKVSTTVRLDDPSVRDERDDVSSINKAQLEEDLSRFDSLRKSYSQADMSEWTDAERRIGELTLSEARSVGGTLPASTGRAASSTRLTHQEANTMAERELGSTFLLPHVHLYKPDLTSDVSEFDSL